MGCLFVCCALYFYYQKMPAPYFFLFYHVNEPGKAKVGHFSPKRNDPYIFFLMRTQG